MLKLWNANTLQEIRSLEGHTQYVSLICDFATSSLFLTFGGLLCRFSAVYFRRMEHTWPLLHGTEPFVYGMPPRESARESSEVTHAM